MVMPYGIKITNRFINLNINLLSSFRYHYLRLKNTKVIISWYLLILAMIYFE